MLATQVARPFSRPGWIFEAKFDGVRALAFVSRGRRRGEGRPAQPARQRDERPVPGGRRGAGRQPVREAVFDGEIVAMDDGVPSFQQIQPRINLSKPAEVERVAAETPVYFYVFDLLYLDGYDLTRVPLDRAQGVAAAYARAGHARAVRRPRA